MICLLPLLSLPLLSAPAGPLLLQVRLQQAHQPASNPLHLRGPTRTRQQHQQHQQQQVLPATRCLQQLLPVLHQGSQQQVGSQVQLLQRLLRSSSRSSRRARKAAAACGRGGGSDQQGSSSSKGQRGNMTSCQFRVGAAVQH